MALFWLLIGGLLVALLWTFGAYNSQPVDLQYYGILVDDAPLWVVAVVPAVLGLLIGLLMSLPSRFRGMVSSRRLSKQLVDRDRTIGVLQQRVVALESTAPAPLAASRELSDVPDVSARSHSRS
ncbi:MAG: LapA family protein [Chloroflexota bacterium]|nr:LapA family protein [Chloroflexota bacterium]